MYEHEIAWNGQLPGLTLLYSEIIFSYDICIFLSIDNNIYVS